tara:strand:+ start:101 stop:484 length:384 start_codon:yes stop_codon:yes gene_type:complete
MDYPYLIAIALIEQNSERAMPLGGKSISKELESEEQLIDIIKSISLDLLMRLMDRTEKGSVNRLAKDKSLLIVKIEMEKMQENLPQLKSNWINSGNTESFINDIKCISNRIWKFNYIQYEGVQLKRI